jgi:hypothetical protein
MRKLTAEERRARALLVTAERERVGCTTMEAITRVNRRTFAETVRPAARPVAETARIAPAQLSDKAIQKIVNQKVREALDARQAPQPAATAATAAPLHQLTTRELDAVAETTLRPAGAASPFWVREDPPTAPVRESAPTLNLAAVPDADLTRALSQMSAEEFSAAGAGLFMGYARQQHATPFWKGAS